MVDIIKLINSTSIHTYKISVKLHIEKLINFFNTHADNSAIPESPLKLDKLNLINYHLSNFLEKNSEQPLLVTRK